jgi:hypothetical protein
MTATLRASKFRLIGGAALALAGLLIAVFLLPDASQQQTQKRKAAADAQAALTVQQTSLDQARAEAGRVKAGQHSLATLLQNMPAQNVGKLQWQLSQRLYDLSGKHQVRLIAVKYGAPAREGAKGAQLESVDVEFNATGVYQNLKAFMLALEGSKLPFAVVGAKMEETDQGAHLTITLRAFRQAPAVADEPQSGEGA